MVPWLWMVTFNQSLYHGRELHEQLFDLVNILKQMDIDVRPDRGGVDLLEEQVRVQLDHLQIQDGQ